MHGALATRARSPLAGAEGPGRACRREQTHGEAIMATANTELTAAEMAACKLVEAALRARVVELRGEHTSGGAPQRNIGQSWPDPADIEVGVPTAAEIGKYMRQCTGEGAVETACLACGLAASQRMYRRLERAAGGRQVPIRAEDDVAWSVCDLYGSDGVPTIRAWMFGQ